MENKKMTEAEEFAGFEKANLDYRRSISQNRHSTREEAESAKRKARIMCMGIITLVVCIDIVASTAFDCFATLEWISKGFAGTLKWISAVAASGFIGYWTATLRHI